MAKKPKPAEDPVDEGEGPPRKKWSGKRIVFIVVPALVVLIAGGVAASMFLGGDEDASAESDGKDAHGKKSDSGHGESAAADDGHGDKKGDKKKASSGHGGGEGGEGSATYIDLPEFLVNLRTTGSRASFLKLAISLEVSNPEEAAEIEAQMPRVIDGFQTYLRELRVEDLSGSAGLFRLKEELLRRINVTLAPAKVDDVLFKEMLIQ